MSTRRDFTADDGWFIGEDKVLRFVIVDEANGVINITGWTLNFKLSDIFSGARLFTYSVGSGITLTSPAAGILDVAVASASTIGLVGGLQYYYSLRRIDSGLKQELAYGYALLQDVYVDYVP